MANNIKFLEFKSEYYANSIKYLIKEKEKIDKEILIKKILNKMKKDGDDFDLSL